MLWIDGEENDFNTKIKNIPDMYKKNIFELRNLGYTIIKNVNSEQLCDEFVNSFEDFIKKDQRLDNSEKGDYFHGKRWIAGHSLNSSTKNTACNEKVLKLLDIIFETEAVVYSSLIFWKGTQQGVHRDTPHFYTNPQDTYFGCWYALEDIQPDSGPLFYYEEGHKLNIPSGKYIYNETKEKFPQITDKEELNFKCLVSYCDGYINNSCNKKNNYKYALINKGDCIIWHPKLPHGGSKINNKSLFRKSCVTHCIPINKRVKSSTYFFSDTYKDSQDYNNLYNDKNIPYNTAPNGRKYISCGVLEGKPIVQTTYT